MTIPDYIRLRLSELHGEVFGQQEPNVVTALAYFGWHARLNELGFGRDYSTHPRNPMRKTA